MDHAFPLLFVGCIKAIEPHLLTLVPYLIGTLNDPAFQLPKILTNTLQHDIRLLISGEETEWLEWFTTQQKCPTALKVAFQWPEAWQDSDEHSTT
jgi:hypothetical protein